ncbi:MAG: diguanylate cyclase [Methylococcaceae bacterium]|nr:diguanylate cyclase [Methylococcaceae bacterium]
MDQQDIEKFAEETAHPLMVLLIDDQEIIATSVRHQLASEKDINFHYCQDPTEAITAAEKIGPTVILLDLIMPKIDGLTLCRFFRTHPSTRDIPIVMLSSEEEPVTKAQAFECGANDYLVKLPDKIELIARLRYHSKAYISGLQRDDAYRALRASQMRLEELNIELLKLANLDGLTGLINRRFFEKRYAEEWLRAARKKYALSVIMFDIDWFKRLNDQFGHLEGDECLKRIASAVREIPTRPADVIARYGGEEFVVLLPETDVHGARLIAERIRTEVEDLHIPNPGSTVRPFVTISAGVATAVPDSESPSTSLIRFADEALYRAKEGGRNCVCAATVPAA